MEPKPPTLGSSILVPCVQELAKEKLPTVPPRYVQHEQEPLTTVYPDSLPHIPIIDMANLVSGDDKELQKLDSACKDWGFFQLINHGVSSILVDKVKVGIQDFFNLPMEDKKKYWQKAGDIEGFGQAFVVSEEQKLDWADIFALTTLPINFRKPHLLPKFPNAFRETLENYSIELKHLVLKMLDYMAKSLKMKPEDMELFEGGMQTMRMNYYPPCPEPEKVIGLTPHTDSAAGITILLQINRVQGLQVKKDGIWIPVEPLPEAFVVNIGDILQIVTNGAYQSIEHRAVVNSSKERLSIATFYSPRYDAEVGPVASLITPECPALYKNIIFEEYIKGFLTRELKGKSYLEEMKI